MTESAGGGTLEVSNIVDQALLVELEVSTSHHTGLVFTLTKATGCLAVVEQNLTRVIETYIFKDSTIRHGVFARANSTGKWARYPVFGLNTVSLFSRLIAVSVQVLTSFSRCSLGCSY